MTEPASPAERWRGLWSRGQSPDVRGFLKTVVGIDPFEAVDVLRVDQRYRWQAGDRVRAVDYLRDFPELAGTPEVAFALVYAEYLLREDLGETPTAEEYCRQFPHLAERLRLQLDIHRTLVSFQPSAVDGEIPPETTDYDLHEVLGRGGQGVVYRARDPRLDRIVALKMFQPGLGAGPTELARFQVEAETIARLRHPNVIQIYEIGDHNGRPYLVLEYAEGGSLAQRISAAPLAAREAAALIEPAARAVHAAHGLGIVHRDVKPANILLTAEGIPKLTDFGMAKWLHTDSSLTQTSAIVGSPCYMAPEQAEGGRREVGPLADVYALGSVLYEAVTGRPPFKAASVLATLAQVRSDPPIPPSRLQPGLSRDLETICLKCLHKEPARRYPTAQALAEDLGRFLAGTPVRARPVALSERAWRWCRSHPLPATLSAAVAILLVVVIAGGLVGFVRVAHERDRAVRAERDVVDKLRNSYVLQARANRLSGQPGQRYHTLKTIAAAVQIAPTLSLRDDIVACLTLPDLRPWLDWMGSPDVITVALDIDADRERYARADHARNVVVLRTLEDEILAQLPNPEGREAKTVRFHPDGRLLAVSYQGRDRSTEHVLWDVESQRIVARFPVQVGWPVFNYSTDGRQAVFNVTDRTLRVIELPSGRALGPDLTAPEIFASAAIRPGNGSVATTSVAEPFVRLFDPTTGEQFKQLPHPRNTRSVAWSDDGTQLAIGCDDLAVYVWDETLSEPCWKLSGHKSEIIFVTFSHSGDLLATSAWDGTTRLYDMNTGRQVLMTDKVVLGFNHDDTRLCYRDVATGLGLWEVLENTAYRVMRPSGHHGLGVLPDLDTTRGLVFSPDGRWLACSGKSGVRIFDHATGKEAARLDTGRAGGVAFHPQGRSILTYGEKGPLLWPWPADADIETDARRGIAGLPRDLGGPVNLSSVHRVGWTADGRAFLLNDWAGDRLVVADLQAPEHRVFFEGHRRPFGLALSRDGRWIAAGSLGSGSGASVWDTRSGQIVKQFPGSHDNATGADVAMSPDDHWLVTANQGEYRFYELGTWKPGPILYREHIESATGPIAFSADGRLLAIAFNRKALQLLDAGTLEPLVTLAPPDPGNIRAVAFSPNSQSLAVTTESLAPVVWDLVAIRRELAAFQLDWADRTPSPR